jgi:hypothetical protein
MVQRRLRLLVSAALVLACDRGGPPAADAAKPDAPPSAKPDAPTPAKPVASADLYSSTDGLVAAPRPAGDVWEGLEQGSTQPGQEASLIKCRHTDRERFFFLMAKDYSVPADQVRTPDVLANEVYPTTYKTLFQSYEIKESKPVTVGTRTGHELRIEATHASMGPIRKRERVLTEGNHVFLLSAEGKPDVFDAESAAIEAWFTGARFKHLP